MSNQKISPVSIQERIFLLDVFRGLAIFGILMVNMPLFYNPISFILLGSQSDGDIIKIIFESFIKFFFEGKFYVLFSMLFGYGFWIFIQKSVPEGVGIIPVYLRRVLVLLLFGAIHVVFLWAGDILVLYAIFGMPLIFFRNVSDRGLIKWAIWLAVIPSVLAVFLAGMAALAMSIPEAADAFQAGLKEGMAVYNELAREAAQIYSTGSFSEIIFIRLKEYQVLLPGVLFVYPVVLAMFLLGAWIACKGYVKNYMEHLPLFKRVIWITLPLGIIFSTLYAIAYQISIPSVPDFWSALGVISHLVGGISFALLYSSTIILFTAKGGLSLFNKLLAPVGRMALTNYLLHSVICTTLFLSYGFGLFGRLEVWHGIVLTIVIFLLQIPFSSLWLKHFNYGPAEWLWRSLTYLKIQPFRKNRG